MKALILIGIILFTTGFFIGYTWKQPLKGKKEITIEKNADKFKEILPSKKKIKRDILTVESNYNSPYHGDIKIKEQINLKPYLKDHSFSLDLGYLKSSLLVGLGYQYKSIGLDLLLGYHLRDKSIDVGILARFVVWRF